MDDVKLLQENLAEYQKLKDDNKAIPWALIKMIICNLASVLTIICKLIPLK